jgi:flagellar biosynthesis regulator FlbT
MKETTVHSLIIARTLLDRAEPLCTSNDRYLASAGLVILQDALETVFFAGLIERGVDEEKALDSKRFEDLIAELKAVDIRVPKSGTLKALNKQRVLTKHYAQVAEPVTVRSYFDAALIAIDSTVRAAIGVGIRELFMADLLQDGRTKEHLKKAEKAIGDRDYLEALIETRKAIFIEFEDAYNVYAWRDHDPSQNRYALGLAMLSGGWNAPYWAKNKKWIEEHVKVPTDYIQVDYDNFRLQAMEYGIHTAEFENVRRLTPAVFRKGYNEGWSVTYAAEFPANNANEKNAKYCLDRAVAFILKKQEHSGARRVPSKDRPFEPPTVYIGRVMFEKPSTESNAVHTIDEGYEYTIKRIVGGFDPTETFYELVAESTERRPGGGLLCGMPLHFFSGFLQIVPGDDDSDA